MNNEEYGAFASVIRLRLLAPGRGSDLIYEIISTITSVTRTKSKSSLTIGFNR
jgi:hypothetical protein